MTKLLLASDSRANGFDKYRQPGDLEIRYIIRRGAKISDLKVDILKCISELKKRENYTNDLRWNQ